MIRRVWKVFYYEVEGEGWDLMNELLKKKPKNHFVQPVYIDSADCVIKGQWKEAVSKQ